MNIHLRNFTIYADILGLLLCGMEITILIMWRRILKGSAKYFLALFISSAITLGSNLLIRIFEGTPSREAYIIMLVSNFLEFSIEYVLAAIFIMYIFHCIENNGGKVRARFIVVIYLIIAIALVIFSQVSGLFFRIDKNNYYERTNFFYVSQIVGIGCVAMIICILIYYRKYIRKQEMNAFIAYLVFPAVGVVLQIFFRGIYFLLLTQIISSIVLFFTILSMQLSVYYEKEKQLSDTRLLLMTSQIQPHFLYNGLTVIKHFCKTDPTMAEETVEQFSKYLRANMDAVVTDECINFSNELTHVKNYIALEKKRFGDRLSISFDIADDDFLLPALTLQPIVENAVKYGTLSKVDGVSVSITEYRDEKTHYIKVEDDGPGFDVQAVKNDGKNHIGIDGVRIRLSSMCGGSLDIQSAPGCGTTALITVPDTPPPRKN